MDEVVEVLQHLLLHQPPSNAPSLRPGVEQPPVGTMGGIALAPFAREYLGPLSATYATNAAWHGAGAPVQGATRASRSLRTTCAVPLVRE